jgi:type IV secretion system protein TrbB
MLETKQEVLDDSFGARGIRKLERDLGVDVLTALNDPKTVEVMLNSDGVLWQERLGEPMRIIGEMTAARAEAVINTVSSIHGKVVGKVLPLVEAELPLDGSRFAGQLPPIVSAPTFAIRKKASAVYPLESYVADGIMSQKQADAVIAAVAAHDNILIVGGTGSGKTTLANAVILEIVRAFAMERIVIIEDTGEIQCAATNYVQYHTTIDVTMTHLLKTSLRMRPDRIIVGEVRGAEALDLVDAWNTGHPGGLATIHANSSVAGLTRLKSLITRNPSAPSEIEPLIGEAVQLVVYITRTPKGRKVQELVKVSGYSNGQYQTKRI